MHIITKYNVVMDNIVDGISQISFKQSLSEIHNKSATTLIKEKPGGMSFSENILFQPEQNCDQGVHNYASNSLNSNEIALDKAVENEDNSEQNLDNRKRYLFSERRKMPSRASKESSLLGIKRRTIMKPSKRYQAIQGDFSSLKPAEVKKIYLNKKLTNFRPSCLETIFEEKSHNETDERNCSPQISARKIRRTLCLSDGLRYTKSLVNKRRTKIKKTLGKRFALKKISLDEFIEKLNNSIEKSEESENENVQIEIDEKKNLPENTNQYPYPNVFSVETFTSGNNICLTSTSSTAATPMEFCTDVSFL